MSHKIIKIGRAPDNDIVLSHLSISRHHLEVFIDPHGNVFITDMESANGTYVNGNKVKGSLMLSKGDILKLGAEKPLQWQNWISQDLLPTSDKDINQSKQIYTVKSKQSEITTIILAIIAFVLITLITFYAIKKMKASPQRSTITSVDTTSTEVSELPVSTIPTSPTSPTSPTIHTELDSSSVPEKPSKQRGYITYDFSCLSDVNDNNQTEILNQGSDINDMVLDAFGDPVSINDEIEYGNRLQNEIDQKYISINYGSNYNMLQNLLQKLISRIPNPRGFNYKLFFLQSDELNAFTAGGRIYITTQLFYFCNTEDELACIIGHEIYHNELGHIKYGIKAASMPGAEIISLITTPFNQKKETACDMHGIDLAISAGYSGCSCVNVWKRMSESVDKNSYDPLDNLFRSHPYSSKRELCASRHLEINYNTSCF
jgi:pSer/pThr/pTyr-binding forkhead associated (FHA) protein